MLCTIFVAVAGMSSEEGLVTIAVDGGSNNMGLSRGRPEVVAICLKATPSS